MFGSGPTAVGECELIWLMPTLFYDMSVKPCFHDAVSSRVSDDIIIKGDSTMLSDDRLPKAML